MGLEKYQSMRDFSRTREPRGSKAKAKRVKQPALSLCVQKHAASHLHYDFRLELDGVLKSWAVPKGPSLDPADKRLAMMTEDHPLDYGDFEGIIPAGEYGGGTVVLWDRGSWTPIGDPHEGLRKGRLKFRLDGEKLKGGWNLVRIRDRGERQRGGSAEDGKSTWLLIKETDADAAVGGASILSSRAESVKSGRSLAQVAADAGSVWHSKRVAKVDLKSSFKPRDLAKLVGARKAALPERFDVELATLVDAAPPGDRWVHEIKFDGYRAICRIERGKARLYTRRGNDWTTELASIADAAAVLPVQTAALDGEVVVVTREGRTDFQSLQNALGTGAPLVFFAFDLLHLDGWDLRGAALLDRKRVLCELLGTAQDGTLRYSQHITGRGQEFFDSACKLHLEGIICKKADAPYKGGRGRDWLKVKCQCRQEFVIGGYTEPKGSRTGFGGLLLGVYDGGELRYAGKVGTGFSHATLDQLSAKLSKLETRESPFVDLARGKGHHWVTPKLVGEVRFTEWTSDGKIRHPSFQGLRADKAAREIVREKARPAGKSHKKADKTVASKTAKIVRSAGGKEVTEIEGVRLTSPSKVMYPDAGITKLELAELYRDIADWVLPHIADRALSIIRCPEGLDRGTLGGIHQTTSRGSKGDTSCFFQKHATATTSKLIGRVEVPEAKKMATYLEVHDVQGLMALVQMGTLELHPWGSLASDPLHPDRMFFDLDPDTELAYGEVISSAREVRRALEAVGLESYLKTTGGKGLHVVVPLARTHDWDEVRRFSGAIAAALEGARPDRYVASMAKDQRKGRIFIDYLRNGRGATAVAAYSTRARPGGPISTPITWDELTEELSPRFFTVRNIRDRLASLRKDPWEGFLKSRQVITPAMKKSVGIK